MARGQSATVSDSAATPPDSAAASPAGPARRPSAAPDSARLSLIQFSVRSFGNIEIATGGTPLRFGRAEVSREGITTRSQTRSITSIRDPVEENLIPWAVVDSVRVRRAGRGIGPTVGGLAGLFVGLAIATTELEPNLGFGPSPTLNPTPVLVSTAIGVGLGWLVDHAGPWHRVYP